MQFPTVTDYDQLCFVIVEHPIINDVWLVMCRLSSAWKPPVKLDIFRPRISKSEAWAVLVGLGQLRLGFGSSRGFFFFFMQLVLKIKKSK